jgi:hypothetical protein
MKQPDKEPDFSLNACDSAGHPACKLIRQEGELNRWLLSATAASGYAFSSWTGGGCSGTGACTVTMTDNVTVTATFAVPSRLHITGNGTVTGTATGLIWLQNGWLQRDLRTGM